MQAIAQQLTTANQNRPESYVNSAPEWDGSGKSQEARHFLAAFANWASSSGGRLNNWRPPVGIVEILAMLQEDGKAMVASGPDWS